jgi:hypothetical protein
MRKLSWLGVLMGLALLFGGLAKADEPVVSPTEWQAVIAGQIQAFRNHDAPGAMMFAGEAFHQAFTDPKDFFRVIINSGYAPIMESRSQSFGPYQMIAPDEVAQEVKLLGNDQSVYEAIYLLSKESEGWRVHGVQLMKTPGMGV